MSEKPSVATLYGQTYTPQQICQEPREFIRLEAVCKHFALTELSMDHSFNVRCAVAKQKASHNILAYDNNWRVRAAVAKCAVNHQIIMHLAEDPNDFVRYVLAIRGLATEQLSHDHDLEISAIAMSFIAQQKAA